MRPILLEIPLPHWALPLGPALFALAALLVLAALFGVRARTWDMVVLGTVGAAVAVSAALRHRGATLPLGSLPIYSYGAFLSASLLAGFVLAQRLAERARISRAVVANATFLSAVAGLFGARLLYVVTNAADFSDVGSVLAFRGGGLVFYGAVLGGTLAAAMYVREKKIPFFAFADVGAPSLALGAALGRLGCYSAGCDYGRPLGAGAPRFLARLGTFPRWPDGTVGDATGSPAWFDQVQYRGLSPDSTASLPVHPSQLYESLGALLLLLLLLRLFRNRPFPGVVFLAFVAGYGALRFFLEILRDDPERGVYGPAAPVALAYSLGALVLAVCFAVGASHAIASRLRRRIALGAAFLVPVVLYGALRGSGRAAAALSTSQWIALGTSIAAAVAFRVLGAGSGRPMPSGGTADDSGTDTRGPAPREPASSSP